MKILILQDDFPPYENGGAGVMAGATASVYSELGHTVVVFTTTQKKELAGTTEEKGIRVVRVYVPWYNERYRQYKSIYNGVAIRALKTLLAKEKPDIVHAHNIHYYISYHALYCARKYTSRVYLTTHDIMTFYQGTFTEFIKKDSLAVPDVFDYRVTRSTLFAALKKRYNPFFNNIVRFYLSKVKKIIAVSHALEDALNQNGIKNTTVIHNGIDLGLWSNVERFDFGNRKVVLFGGRLSGAKGGLLILDAMSLIAKEVPEAMLCVFGKKDAYAERIAQKATQLGIADHIMFTGWHGEDVLRTYFAGSDVVVVPSVCFDSFPTVNLHGFASKKPVVATCFGGSRELVDDNVNGFIVNPFDVPTLAKRISTLLKDTHLAQKFGKNGYQKIQNGFTLRKMGEEYIRLFSFE